MIINSPNRIRNSINSTRSVLILFVIVLNTTENPIIILLKAKISRKIDF